MKTRIIGALTLLLVSGATAQTVLPTTYFSEGKYSTHWQAYRYAEPIQGGGINWWRSDQVGIKVGAGLNLMKYNDLNRSVNETVSDGTLGILRGVSGTPTATFGIYNRMTGQIYADNGSASTTLLGLDDPEISRIDGRMAGGGVVGRASNAITIIGGVAGNWTFDQGNYFGGAGFSGAHFNISGTMSITGTSFVAGSYLDGGLDINNWKTIPVQSYAFSYAAPGLFLGTASSVFIDSVAGKREDRFEGATFGSLDANPSNQGFGSLLNGRWMVGGSGLEANVSGNTEITGGTFIGSQQDKGTSRTINYTGFNVYDANLNASGGHGANLQGAGALTIHDGLFIGGQAGEVYAGGPNATVEAIGGSGLALSGKGVVNLLGGTYRAGSSGPATISRGEYYDDSGTVLISDTNGNANALGGSGIRIYNSGATTIGDVEAYGSRGSTASGSANATATGGSGLLARNTAITITNGLFVGADGGYATSEGSANARGGAGAYVDGGILSILGGEFTGGKGGQANGKTEMGNIGVWAQDASLVIDEASGTAPTKINGSVYFNNASLRNLDIKGGTIAGDILKTGAGTATMSVGTNATYSGVFIQEQGDVTVVLAASDEAGFFSDVNIQQDTLTFTNQTAITAENASFALGGAGAVLDFTQGLELSRGASIKAGYGQVSSGVDLVMGADSTLSFNYDSLSGTGGTYNVAGAFVASNANNKITASAISSTPTGSLKVITSGSVILGGNTLSDVVGVDVGWLSTTDWTNSSTVGGITVAYEYNSLSNMLGGEINADTLAYVDARLVDTNKTSQAEFRALNSVGESAGKKMYIHALSQLPDVAGSSLQVQQQVADQIAKRGTEFRSMSGYASTQPSFGKKAAPVGAAGPESDGEETMQGWIRAYGAFASRDKQDNFASYDSGTWGTVVGVDKSFGNILIGLAGGYARADLDAGGAYAADIDSYHGSLYGTFGGESVFFDMALTYGLSKTEEKSPVFTAEKFDSDIFSLYLGGGKTFDIKEKLAITPELSLLTSYYTQDAYNRTGSSIDVGTIADYDTWSYLGSLGVNLATVHQVDWMSQSLAFIPEVRVHWLHEFNPDLDNFSYTIGGITDTFGVRPRDEDLLRLGFGLDIWSWRRQNTKFEIDYDGLFSSDYAQHIFSGKVTTRF